MLILFVVGAAAQECTQKVEMGVSVHPHLDIYWLNNYEELSQRGFIMWDFLRSMNQRSSRQIFDQALEAFRKNNKMRFFFSEMFFFQDWYRTLSKDQQKLVKALLEGGQWEAVGGGWVEQDQACTYIDDLAEHYVLGQQFLLNQLGYRVVTGWNTDSFGHSSSSAAIMALAGMKYFGFERIDERYIMQNKSLQFEWQPFSHSNNKTYGSIRTHLRYFLHQFYTVVYGDPTQQFSKVAKAEKDAYHKSKIFKFIGNDFQMVSALEFELYQQLFDKFNFNPSSCLKLSWQNPRQYFEGFQNQTLPIFTHDFMPNWDQGYYWSGYFTSGPALKKRARLGSVLLNSVRKLIILKNGNVTDDLLLHIRKLESNVSVLQHHDGVTYTSKDGVFDRVMSLFTRAVADVKSHIPSLYVYDRLTLKQHNQFFIQDHDIKVSDQTFDFAIQNIGEADLRLLRFRGQNAYGLKGVQAQSTLCFAKDGCLSAATLPMAKDQMLIVKGAKNSSAVKCNLVNLTAQQQQILVQDKFNANASLSELCLNWGPKSVCISLFTSSMKFDRYESTHMDKFLRVSKQSYSVASGKYIMGNSGEQKQVKFASLEYGRMSDLNLTVLLLRRDSLKVEVQVSADGKTDLMFTTSLREESDLFVKYRTNVQSNVLYHDSNGYLVEERKANFRQTHQTEFTPRDKFNGNTYPATTFAYLKDTDTKFAVNIDRPEGVVAYQQQGVLIFNIDRKAGEDGKGVGEQLYVSNNQTIHHVLSFSTPNQFPERIAQRRRDQAPIVMPLASAVIQSSGQINPESPHNQNFIKTNIHLLGKQTILLRIFNLHDLEVKQFKLFEQFEGSRQLVLNAWKFAEIREYDLGGVGLKSTVVKPTITLQPLQVRTFKVARVVGKPMQSIVNCLYQN